MAIARSFRDLNVYREARETAQKIFELSREFPAEDDFCKHPPATDYRAIPRVGRNGVDLRTVIQHRRILRLTTSHPSPITSHT